MNSRRIDEKLSTLDDPDVDNSAAERELHTARADAAASLMALIDGAS